MASYVPRLPFDGYKWYWACKAPTEALNDPAVLLGVLRIIDNLADRGFRYSSPAFSSIRFAYSWTCCAISIIKIWDG